MCCIGLHILHNNAFVRHNGVIATVPSAVIIGLSLRYHAKKYRKQSLIILTLASNGLLVLMLGNWR